MTENTMTPGVRPALRGAAIVIFVVLLPVAAHALWDYVEIQRLAREIQAIRAKGEPVTEQEAGRGYRPLTEEQDLGARYYTAAAVLARPAMAGPAAGRATSALQAFLAGHAPQTFDLSGVTREIASTVERGRPALGLAAHAASLPFNGFAGGSEYNYRTSELLDLARLQSLHVAHASLAGDATVALPSAIAAMKTRATIPSASGWAQWPKHDVAVLLSFSKPGTEGLRRLLKELQALDSPDGVQQLMIKDRASFLDRTVAWLYGGDPYALHASSRRPVGFRLALWRPQLTRSLVDSLQTWSHLVEAAGRPSPNDVTALDEIYETRVSPRQRPGPPFSSESLSPRNTWWTAPSVMINAIPPPRFDTLARDRASATAVAVALYHSSAGRMPDTLEELRGAYLTELPRDPWTGAPLHYKLTDEAFTVYSVGPDRHDDGGDLTSHLEKVDEQGWGRREIAGRDIGIRVLRQRPAVPRRPGTSDAGADPMR